MRKLGFGLMLILCSFLVQAQVLEEVDVGALQPLVDTVRPLFLQASVLLGGIFGVYLLLLVARVYYERQTLKLLKDIRYDLDNLNMHYGLAFSRQRKGYIRKCFRWIKEVFRRKGKKK
jgi:hypothetical protein